MRISSLTKSENLIQSETTIVKQSSLLYLQSNLSPRKRQMSGQFANISDIDLLNCVKFHSLQVTPATPPPSSTCSFDLRKLVSFRRWQTVESECSTSLPLFQGQQKQGSRESAETLRRAFIAVQEILISSNFPDLEAKGLFDIRDFGTNRHGYLVSRLVFSHWVLTALT